MTTPNWLEFWYDAMASSHGIILIVDDSKRAIQALYRARASSKDPSLAALSIRTSPVEPNTEIWITKNA